MKLLLSTLCLASPAAFEPLASQTSSVVVEVLPETVFVEAGKSRQHLNFDFRFRNETRTSVQLVRVDLRVFDRAGSLVQRRYVDRGGTAPGIDVFAPATIPASGSTYIFNPYHDFDLEVELARLEYDFTFSLRGLAPVSVSAWVEPRRYEQKVELRLPMEGRLLVVDGHDFLSHHRRVDLDFPPVAAAGLTANSNRYAYDLVVVDELGRTDREATGALEDNLSWGATVLAPAPGRVVVVVGDFPDNRVVNGRVQRDPRVSLQDVETFAGNYVVIDHGRGELSSLGHLRRGSVSVEIGERVERGQPIAELGLSGATDHVHLHYQLQDDSSFGGSEGLPSLFSHYRRHLGSRSLDVERGQIDSGDIVEMLGARDDG